MRDINNILHFSPSCVSCVSKTNNINNNNTHIASIFLPCPVVDCVSISVLPVGLLPLVD